MAVAIGAVAALATAPAWAQEAGPANLDSVQLSQATTGVGAGQTQDDAALLSAVLAALPAGVTLETATDDQIAAAVGAAVTGATVPGANPVGAGEGGMPTAAQVPGTQGEARIASVTAQVLSVLSVTLDSIGRGTSASSVATRVTNTLPPSVRGQVQQTVASSRNNPTPSQVAATSVVIAQTQPAAGQQQQQQQVTIVPIVPTGQQSLGQSVFQENPNQVSPS